MLASRGVPLSSAATSYETAAPITALADCWGYVDKYTASSLLLANVQFVPPKAQETFDSPPALDDQYTAASGLEP